MTTLTFPLSRIEGHARVEIEVRDGKVISTRFQAMEKRGFNLMVRGVPAEQMPVIVPRICGVCSTAHHVASVKALEDAYGVVPPPTADKIRELLLLGQFDPKTGDFAVRVHHAGPVGGREPFSRRYRRGR
jgi:F420-non-reducing hydrogenase large subunit